MKKLLAVLALASISLSGFAQDANTTEKYSVATNSFWSNWFVQANVAGSAFWGNQEVGNNFSKSPFKGFRNNLVSVSVQSSMVFGAAQLFLRISQQMLTSIGH